MKKSYIYITLITLFAFTQLPGFAQDWNIQTIGNNISSSQLIQVDNNGNPHCLVGSNYYKWDGLSWQHSTVNGTTFCLNDDGVPHFTYSIDQYRVGHQYLENNQWQIDTVGYKSGSSVYVAPIAIFYGPNSIADKPDILWRHRYYVSYNSYAYHVYVSKWDIVNQEYILVHHPFSAGRYTSLHYEQADYCTDQAGNLYYVYTGASDEIVFNFYDGTTWSSFNITDGTNDCMHPRITLDQNDIPHISYYDEVTKDLIHAVLPAQTMMMLKEGKLQSKVPSQIISE